jgi:hypothetical protein
MNKDSFILQLIDYSSARRLIFKMNLLILYITCSVIIIICNVMAASPSAVGRNRSNTGFGNYLDIFVKTLEFLGQKMLKILTMRALSILKLCD